MLTRRSSISSMFNFLQSQKPVGRVALHGIPCFTLKSKEDIKHKFESYEKQRQVIEYACIIYHSLIEEEFDIIVPSLTNLQNIVHENKEYQNVLDNVLFDLEEYKHMFNCMSV